MTEEEVLQSERTESDATGSGTIRAAKSLSPEIRKMLLECPSHQAFFQRILDVCFDTFKPVIGRVDFRVGEEIKTATKVTDRMATSLAKRFNDEYIAPFAESVMQDSAPEPRLKHYERGDQKMSLLCAPVMNLAGDVVAGTVTLMLAGDQVRPEIVLPRMDGIVSVASAVMLLKTRPPQAATTATAAPRDNAHSTGAGTSSAGSTNTASPNASAAVVDPAIAQNSALARTAQFRSTREFGYSIVNSLSPQLGAEQAAFGVVNNGRVQVEAISAFADFKASSPGVQMIRQAMEECLDHGEGTVAQQQEIEGVTVLPIHRQWSAENRNSCVCSIPLRDGQTISGVISIRRPADRPFAQEELAKLQQMLAPYGGAIRVIEKANRSMATQVKTAVTDSARQNLGKGKMGRKVALIALLVGLGWFLFGSLTYRPICRTRVTASDLRHFSAPYDGKLKAVHVKPGSKVSEGDLLVEFDTDDLMLQLNGIERELTSTQVELRQSIEAGELSAAALARARLNVLVTQARAIEKQISEAKIVAPTDGTVVLSDLEQRIGQVFPQGEEILQLAPAGDWMLEIEIPDDVISYVKAEQQGTFVAASQPTDAQEFKIEHVDGAAEMVEERNVFIATAPLQNRPEWMLTGMEGTARVETERRPVWWVALHRVVDWARMNFWL